MHYSTTMHPVYIGFTTLRKTETQEDDVTDHVEMTVFITVVYIVRVKYPV